jgi:hypothetical protein
MNRKVSCALLLRFLPIAIIPAWAFILTAGQCIENKKSFVKKNADDNSYCDEPSIWESEPIEIDNVKVQILDKVSGKVYREIIKSGFAKVFGSIELKLKRCFKNGPEDNKEISAFIEINEEGQAIFENWLFASAPSVNLFAHPVYDIRIEF